MNPGDYLDEFKIVQQLGAGGFGIVYLARDTNLDRLVAIKELHGLVAVHDAVVRRFRQEATAAGGLNHPNIVTVHGLRIKGNYHYLIMEYVSGGSLRDLLKTQGRLDPGKATRIGRDVCAALAQVHAKGIVHRDIKPENILLTEDDQAKISDFGIAHVPRSAGGVTMTHTGFQPGTLLYMSPEQARGEKPLTVKSDVYQVGVVLFEMLCGRHYLDLDQLQKKALRRRAPRDSAAFQAQSKDSILKGIRQSVTLDPDIPSELASLVTEAMSAAAEDRPDAQEMEKRLGMMVSDQRQPQSEASRRSKRRDRSVEPRSKAAPAALSPADAKKEGARRAQEARRLREQGELCLARGEYRSAVGYFDQSIEIESTVSAWVGRGDAFRLDGDLERAIDDYSAVLRGLPDHFRASYGRGVAYRQLGNALSAIEDLCRATEIDPRSVWAWTALGAAHELSGEFKAAIQDYTRAIELDLHDPLAWAGLGDANRANGDLDRALAAYNRALVLQPNQPSVMENVGLIYEMKGELDRAVAEYSQLIEASPSYVRGWEDRGRLHIVMGDLDRAVDDFSLAGCGRMACRGGCGRSHPRLHGG